MINLTDFISNKLNKVPFNVQKYPVKEQQSFSRKKNNFIQQSFSQNSIGLSTLLDLQNQEENFERLQISRIGGWNKNSNFAKGERQLVKTRSVKSELQEMRQKRRNVQKRVNQVLVKEQTRNYSKYYKNEIKSNIRSRQNSENTLINQGQTSKLQSQISRSQYSSSQHSLQEQQSQQSHLSQQRSQSEQSGSKAWENFVFRDNRNNLREDRFMVYLKKDIYTLKCQRFIESVKRFKSKFLIRQLFQWVEFCQIIKREQKKLCRFVFIEWKRFVNQQSRKSAMVQMIRNRVQLKKTLKEKQQDSIVPKRYQQPIKLNKTQPQTINQQKTLSIYPKQTRVRDISTQIPEKNKAEQYSQLTLRQISPIKSIIQNISMHTQDHNQSYYDRYSCYTENQSEDEEEFIK